MSLSSQHLSAGPSVLTSLPTPRNLCESSSLGADVLFEDPSRRSTSVGITVNPVKVVSLEQFGRLGEVGEKLLAAERNKVCVCVSEMSNRRLEPKAACTESSYHPSTRTRILTDTSLI